MTYYVTQVDRKQTRGPFVYQAWSLPRGSVRSIINASITPSPVLKWHLMMALLHHRLLQLMAPLPSGTILTEYTTTCCLTSAVPHLSWDSYVIVPTESSNMDSTIGDDDQQSEEEEEQPMEVAEAVDIKEEEAGQSVSLLDNIAVSDGPVLKSGKTLQGIKIVLPGFSPGEKPKVCLFSRYLLSNSSLSKDLRIQCEVFHFQLRSKPKPPPPAPKPSETNENTPPWLGETRLRKSRPPKGEVEKLKQETEPEKPSWMKDAAAKRKRASQFLLAKEQGECQKATSLLMVL